MDHEPYGPIAVFAEQAWITITTQIRQTTKNHARRIFIVVVFGTVNVYFGVYFGVFSGVFFGLV
jgi:hypothetical protein